MDWNTFTGILAVLFDASWVDICTFCIALVYTTFKATRTPEHAYVSLQTGRHFLYGLPLFPLFLLAGAGVSSPMLTALVLSNKVILSGAGILALLAILEE